jgi:hypothetical protein
MVLRVSRFLGDRHPERAWWALTTDKKADLAGGNPGGDPAKQVYFAVARGGFRSGQYQFFSIKADPQTHQRFGLVVGGGFDRTAGGAMAAFDPYCSLSAKELSAAEAVVRRLVTAVDDDDFAGARALMINPDASWSLEDMRSIRWVRLRRVALLRVDAPHTAWLITDLRRQPPPMAGNDHWPNFMLVVRTSSGEWKVTATATGP